MYDLGDWKAKVLESREWLMDETRSPFAKPNPNKTTNSPGE